MAAPQTIPRVVFLASSFGSVVDLLSSDIRIGAQNLGASLLRIQMTLSASAVVSVITKGLAASVIGSCQLQGGSAITENAAYAWVFAMNNQSTYNLQISRAATIIGQVDEIQGAFI